MNRNKILGIFILFALLITCIGVSFASNDFDDSYIDDNAMDYDIIDDMDIDDSYIDDDDIDDEDDLDDEDWEDYDDEDDLDDEDWEDFDDEFDTAYYKKGNWTGHYYYLTAYSYGKAMNYGYMASNSDYSSNDNEKIAYKTPASASASDNNNKNYENSYSDANVLPNNGISQQNSVVKSIDLNELEDSYSSDESGNTSVQHKLTKETNNVNSNENEYGILALFALLIVSLVIII